MQYTINQLYDHLFQKTNTIYDIFKNFFGEANVDLQTQNNEDSIKARLELTLEENHIKDSLIEANEDTTYEVSDNLMTEIEEQFAFIKSIIYVWWSNVTVTNEYDRSVQIQDLYAKVEVKSDGRIPYAHTGFLLNRATYPIEQFQSDYLHSHIEGIPKYDFTQFNRPCLGNGPIKDTILTLKNDYNEVSWMLFCQELSTYVTVESIEGGPWRRMERIGSVSKLASYENYDIENANPYLLNSTYSKDITKQFFEYYLRNGHLSLSYRYNKFICGMPFYEFILDISNSFIEFFNKYLSSNEEAIRKSYRTGILNKVIFSNGSFYSYDAGNNASQDIDRYQNKLVLTFKGKEIRTKIYKGKDSTNKSPVTLLNSHIANYVLKNILRTINYRYKNEYINKKGGESPSSSPSQRVFYL